MNFSFLPQFWSYFNYGVLVTIMISVCVVFFGTILGVLVSLAKRSGIKPLEWLVSLYVWVFRGTPMVVQIMIAFNLIHMNLPTVQFGILNLDLSRIVPGIIVLSLNSGAYISESVRAGIEFLFLKVRLKLPTHLVSVHGIPCVMWSCLKLLKISCLPWVTSFVTIIKDSSLLQTIGVMELWNGAQTVATTTYLTLTPLLFAAFYYLIVTTAMTALLKQMEKTTWGGT